MSEDEKTWHGQQKGKDNDKHKDFFDSFDLSLQIQKLKAMKLRGSEWHSQSEMDSIRNACDV